MRCNIYLWNKPLKNGLKKVKIDCQNGRSFRKYINTNLKVNPLHWDTKKQRVKRNHENANILNKALDELQIKLRVAEDKFHTNQFSEQDVIAFLEGKTAFGSIDEYIETEIKNSRSSATYTDYKNAFNSLKLHTDFSKSKLMFEDVNYSLLDKFKRSALSKGRSGASVNSYLKKIRAVMNDAYDKGFIYEKFELNKKLSVPVRRTIIKTCTTEDFEIAIAKVKTLYDWQSLAFYLLMFCTRGMYPADIVNFKRTNFQNKDMKMKVLNTITNEYEEADILAGMLCVEGYDYLLHRRSKTSNKANADMLIRIDDFPTFELITTLKFSIIYTHYNKRPEIIPQLEDNISIFKYDVVKDYNLHSNIWDYYTKRVKKLLGYSFNTARKTFNTYALELQVSDTIRRILLGHADPTMLSHYDNLNTKEVIDQVENAHTSVLARFKASELTRMLLDKLEDINAPKNLYDKSLWLGSLKQFIKYHKKDLL